MVPPRDTGLMSDEQHHSDNREPPVNERGRAYDPDVTDDERTYAMWMHLALLAHIVLSIFAIIIPIAMWATKKDDSPFLDDHGREAVNFQISLFIITFIAVLISIPIGLLTCGVGFILGMVPYVVAVVGMIQASQAANRGEFYRYPMTFRFF